MAWFKRSKDNIASDTQKRDVPDGTWIKCPECSEMMHKMQWEANMYLCTKCGTPFKETIYCISPLHLSFYAIIIL